MIPCPGCKATFADEDAMLAHRRSYHGWREKNMSVLSNLISSNPDWRVALCDACHSKRFGWHVVTISSGRIS